MRRDANDSLCEKGDAKVANEGRDYIINLEQKF